MQNGVLIPYRKEGWAMSRYNPQEIEPKWQTRWYSSDVYKAFNPNEKGFDPKKKPFYVLDMFPYPSGSGLHVGHASGYIGTDIVARRKRMENCNVLHPMGWDAFGLPAEQYAIQTGQHPRITTDVNTANFKKQLKLLGLSYDWSREFDTSDPKYYKWTQWIFLQLFKKGLIYRKEMPVWWCEDLKTVLANEEVINGRSERGNYVCVRKPLTQWVFKITEYADRLLEDLAELDWPESIKKQQSDWIGKSLGAEVDFIIADSQNKITVFTTRPDTLYGVVAVVLAPEHPLVKKLTSVDCKKNVDEYISQSMSKSDRERKAEVEETTGVFIGAYCEHPLIKGKKVPIWVGDYVLFDYGTGSVMCVPAHDDRDYRFAKKYQMPIDVVIVKEQNSKPELGCFVDDGFLLNSEEFSGLASEVAREKITAKLEYVKRGRAKIFYKIRDWVFSRQRYWGEPFPLYINEKNEVVVAKDAELPILLPEMQDFKPSADGSSPLARVPDWINQKDAVGNALKRVTDTMPGWAGSCWYYLRFMDANNPDQAFSESAVNYWNSVDLYVGGASHAVMHLLYARFWHKILFDLKIVPTKEPFKKLFNQGMVTAFAFKDKTGRLVPSDEVESHAHGFRRKSNGEEIERIISKMAKSLKNVVNPDDVVAEKGCDVLRMYEMFMGPLDAEKPWADEGITGCEKFLRRIWAHFVGDNDQIKDTVKYSAESPAFAKIEFALHKCLKRINYAFENFSFNTAVAALMEALNEIQEAGSVMTQAQSEFYLKMLFPLAPHIASELWERFGYKEWIDYAAWPVLDESKLVQDSFELVLQVNGKIRKKLEAKLNIGEAEAWVLAEKELSEWITGKTIVKKIFVPNKLMNIVVK
jgi:leucyl-tRNA synthetase